MLGEHAHYGELDNLVKLKYGELTGDQLVVLAGQVQRELRVCSL